MQCCARSSGRFRPALSRFAPVDFVAIQQFPLKLIGRRMIAPTVAHLSFVRDDGLPLDFIPGQFIQVHFSYADGTAPKRSYSISVTTCRPAGRSAVSA